MQMCLTHKQTSEYIYFTQPIQKVFVLMCKQMSKPPPPRAFPAAAHKVQGYRRSVSASKTTTTRTTTTSCEPSEPKPSQGNPAPGQESVEFSCRQALQCITHTFAHTHTLSLSDSLLFYLSLCQSVKTIQEWVCQWIHTLRGGCEILYNASVAANGFLLCAELRVLFRLRKILINK